MIVYCDITIIDNHHPRQHLPDDYVMIFYDIMIIPSRPPSSSSLEALAPHQPLSGRVSKHLSIQISKQVLYYVSSK